jgi:hypothetical protein
MNLKTPAPENSREPSSPLLQARVFSRIRRIFEVEMQRTKIRPIPANQPSRHIFTRSKPDQSHLYKNSAFRFGTQLAIDRVEKKTAITESHWPTRGF